MVGALIFLQKLRISPDAAFSVNDWTAFVIFIAVIGGIGTIEGPDRRTILFFLLRETLADLGSIYLMILGAVAILVMLKAPRGLWGLVCRPLRPQPLSGQRRVVGRVQFEPSQGANHGGPGSKKVIITCAITGGIHTPTMSDALALSRPTTSPRQAIDAAEAGAAILHLHARDPGDRRADARPRRVHAVPAAHQAERPTRWSTSPPAAA